MIFAVDLDTHRTPPRAGYRHFYQMCVWRSKFATRIIRLPRTQPRIPIAIQNVNDSSIDTGATTSHRPINQQETINYREIGFKREFIVITLCAAVATAATVAATASVASKNMENPFANELSYINSRRCERIDSELTTELFSWMMCQCVQREFISALKLENRTQMHSHTHFKPSNIGLVEVKALNVKIIYVTCVCVCRVYAWLWLSNFANRTQWMNRLSEIISIELAQPAQPVISLNQ